METAWPDIHLEAVNKTAAFLLTRQGVNPEPIKEYSISIRRDMEAVDEAISSILGQLETRKEPEWASCAKRALKRYQAQQRTLKRMLHASNEALVAVTTRIKENEKTLRSAAIESAHQQAREENRKAKLNRIAEANDRNQRIHVIFKRKVAELIGRDKCVELLNASTQEDDSVNPL